MKSLERKEPYNKSQMIAGYLLILPAFALFAVFFVYCVLMAVRYSALNWDGIGEQIFVGMDNYRNLFRDHIFWKSFYNNWLYAAGILAFGAAPGMVLAYLLAMPGMRWRTAFRSVYFLPRIISSVIYGVIWQWMFDPRKGLLPMIIGLFGGDGSAFAVLGSESTAMLGITITGGWTYFGFCMVIFLAAFQGVDPALEESAVLDGASKLKIFFHIVLPMIRPVINTVIIYTIIDSFKVFDLVLVMTSGGPNDATSIMTYFIYKQAFNLNKYGYGSAAAIILGVAMLVFTIIYNRLAGREDVQ